MSLISSLYDQYGISAVVSDGIEIVYSYNVIDPAISSLDISFQFSDEDQSNYVDLIVGRKAPYTQQILNNMPMWMEMRKNYNSNGSKLVNAWGQNLERLIDLYATYKKDQFISTADLYNDIQATASELTGKGNKAYSSLFKNYLFNSSFSMKSPARHRKPLGWSANRDHIDCIEYDQQNSIFGSHGISFNGALGGSQLNQTRTISIPAGPLTLSIFVKTSQDTGGSSSETWDAHEAGLIIDIMYIDSTVATYGVGFPKNTSNKWTRASLTTTLTKEVHKVDVHILNRTSYKYICDCPMLESSSAMSVWTPSLLDVHIYTGNTTRSVTGVQALFDSLDSLPAKKIEVFPVGTESIFKNIKVPTRIEAFTIDGSPENYVNQLYSRHINFFEELMPTQWTASNGSIKESSYITPDIMSSRKPADIILTHDGDQYLDISLINDDAISVKAVCAYDDYLFVVTNETYVGRSGYYLKVVEPRVTDYDTVYMPSIGDIEIPIQLSGSFGPQANTEDILRVGICRGYPNCIFIDTTLNRRLYFKLYYDYYYADFGVRRIYCRENYSSDNGRLQII